MLKSIRNIKIKKQLLNNNYNNTLPLQYLLLSKTLLNKQLSRHIKTILLMTSTTNEATATNKNNETNNKSTFINSWMNPLNFVYTKLNTLYWPTKSDSSHLAEAKLLSRINLDLKYSSLDLDTFSQLNTNDEIVENKVKAYVQQVQIGEEEFINTLSLENKTNQKDKNKADSNVLVMTHGFGVGLGIYYKNYESVTRNLTDWKIYSIDWLGMGRSTRTKFNLQVNEKNDLNNKENITNKAESFFVEALEKWRAKMNLNKMVLLGHSLGGYLSVCYALKYPERVQKLILVSPVGVPNRPAEYVKNNNDNSKNKSSPSRIAIEQQRTIDNPVLKTSEHDVDIENKQSEPEFNVPHKIPAWVSYLWNKNVTPQYLIRMMGPYGPKLVEGYISRRFRQLEMEEQQELKDYIYHISSMKGSGEYALGTILSPGAYARNPLCNRLHLLKMPTTFIYGEVDWMDHRHASKLLHKMNNAKVFVVPKAGHQLFIENPDYFNKLVVDECKD